MASSALACASSGRSEFEPCNFRESGESRLEIFEGQCAEAETEICRYIFRAAANNFLLQAITYNQRIAAAARAIVSASEQSQRQKQELPRRLEPGMGAGALKGIPQQVAGRA